MEIVDQSVKIDYSFAKPNPRYLHTGFMLPSLDGEEMGHVVIAVDTSGSVAPKELDMFAAEITSILQDLHAECDVVYCDSIVRNTQHFTFDDLPVSSISRAGLDGLSSAVQIGREQEHSAGLFNIPDRHVLLRFPEEPNYPTLWVRIGDMKISRLR